MISLGHKDNVTVPQVRQNTEMESHEEKLHKMIMQSKINDTKVRPLCTCNCTLSVQYARFNQSLVDAAT